MDAGDDSSSLPYLNPGGQDWSIHKQVLLINIYIHLPLAGTHSSSYSPPLLLEIVPVGAEFFFPFGIVFTFSKPRDRGCYFSLIVRDTKLLTLRVTPVPGNTRSLCFNFWQQDIPQLDINWQSSAKMLGFSLVLGKDEVGPKPRGLSRRQYLKGACVRIRGVLASQSGIHTCSEEQPQSSSLLQSSDRSRRVAENDMRPQDHLDILCQTEG